MSHRHRAAGVQLRPGPVHPADPYAYVLRCAEDAAGRHPCYVCGRDMPERSSWGRNACSADCWHRLTGGGRGAAAGRTGDEEDDLAALESRHNLAEGLAELAPPGWHNAWSIDGAECLRSATCTALQSDPARIPSALDFRVEGGLDLGRWADELFRRTQVAVEEKSAHWRPFSESERWVAILRTPEPGVNHAVCCIGRRLLHDPGGFHERLPSALILYGIRFVNTKSKDPIR